MKKNKTLKVLAITIPVLMIGIMIYLFTSFEKKKEKVNNLQKIPAFGVIEIRKSIITQDSLATGNKVLVYFSPTCNYCQAEVEELSKVYSKYPNIQWLFIASEPLEEIRTFAKQYNLDNKDNILWARDEQAKAYQTFGMTSIPYFLAYNTANKLVFRNSGAVKIEKIIEHFDEEK